MGERIAHTARNYVLADFLLADIIFKNVGWEEEFAGLWRVSLVGLHSSPLSD